MGQYWKPVNLDKKEYLHAHDLDGGLKLLEQTWSAGGVAGALVLLLAASPEKRGGGDAPDTTTVGRWAGDRIVFVGDYSKDSDMPSIPDFGSLYEKLDDDSGEGYVNISAIAARMLANND